MGRLLVIAASVYISTMNALFYHCALAVCASPEVLIADS